MVLRTRVELVFSGWKPDVLTDRRTQYSGGFLCKENHQTFSNASGYVFTVDSERTSEVTQHNLLYIKDE